MNDRSNELYLAIAKDLEDGCTPLNERFLQEHKVSFDECISLTDGLANFIKGIVYAPKHIRLAVLVAGACDNPEKAGSLVAYFEGARARDKVLALLGEMNSKAPQTENNRTVASVADGDQ